MCSVIMTNPMIWAPAKWHVRPAKTQLSLGIHRVWSRSSLSACRKLGSLATHSVQSKDSYQAGQMPRLIWIFAGRTRHFVVFIMRCLICSSKEIIFIFSLIMKIRAQLFETNDGVSKRIVKTLMIKYGIYSNIFAEKMWVAFVLAKATHIFFNKITVN